MPSRKKPAKQTHHHRLVIAGIVGALSIFALKSFSTQPLPSDTSAVLGRSYPLAQADIHAGEGGTIVDSDVSVIVSEGTFDSDVYLRVDRTLRGNPVSVQGLWQVGDMWNVRLRYHANDDEVSQAATKKSYIVAFPYTQDYLKTDQGVRFDENKLKLVRGETSTGPWTVLTGSVVDTVNKRISVVTQQGGHYFVGGGFYAPVAVQAPVAAQTASSKRVVLKPNEIVVTVTPTPSPTPRVKDADTATPTDEPAIGGADIEDQSTAGYGFFEGMFEFFKSLFRK